MNKDKKVVAFFLPSMEPGGTERNVVNIVNNIDREKYALSLVLGKASGDFIKQINKDVSIINSNRSSSLGLFLKLVDYFKTERPDIFVSSFTRINIICIVAKIFARVNTKIIATEHAVFSFLQIIAKTPWRRFFAKIFLPGISKLVYPLADSIICVSRGIADDLIKIVNCKNKIKVINNPIINKEIYELLKEPIYEKDFLDANKPIILAVGRLVKCKDYPTLFKAFRLVLKNFPAKLVILGKGPEEKYLINLVDKLGLAENIFFAGFKKNPYKYMNKASVFVLSSMQEGFGNVIVEAMACGTPVVSTDCPVGPGEIIQDKINGLLVPPQDEKALADAILIILNDPVLAKKLSAEGEKRAEIFSIKKSVLEYEKVFQELTK